MRFQPTVSNCVEFLKFHKVMKGWSDEQITLVIKQAVVNCCLTYTTDYKNKLTGVCLCKWNNSNSLHVIALIAPNNIWHFVKYLKLVYPNVKQLTYNRKSQPKTLNFK